MTPQEIYLAVCESAARTYSDRYQDIERDRTDAINAALGVHRATLVAAQATLAAAQKGVAI